MRVHHLNCVSTCPLGEKERGARLANQARLRELRRTDAATFRIFCSHDMREFERLSGRWAALPAEFLREVTSRKDMSNVGMEIQ